MRGVSRTALAIGIVAVVAVGVCAYASYRYITYQKEWDFFASAAQTISENVTVDGVTYHVESGVVTEQDGAHPTQSEQLAALRLAYALTLARRNPLFDLAGNDVSNLRSAISDLTSSQKEIEQSQASSTDQELVTNLHPISFLNALADLEQARETFIASGKDTDEQAYEAALNTAVDAGSTDIQNFKAAYDQVGHPSYALVAGVVQGSAIDAELQNIANGFSAVGVQAKARSACIAGDVWNCDPSDIAIDLAQATTTGTLQLPTVAQEVEQIYQGTGYGVAVSQVMLLPSDPCLASLGVQPYFESTLGYPSRILFVGDMYFTKISPQDEDLFHNLGVSYLYYDPIKYYTCIENGLIFAQARAASVISSTFQNTSTSSVISYQNEVAALSSALQNDPPEQQNTLLDAYLMVKDNDGSFSSVIEDIAHTEDLDVSQQQAGVSSGGGPAFLFDAKSGFYDLFMAYNPSFGSKPIDLYSSPGQSSLLQTLLAWSQLRGSVPMQKIISDLNVYDKYHVDPEAVVYALPTSTPPVFVATSTPPSTTKTYQNATYEFSLTYPQDLTATENPLQGESMTVVFQNQSNGQGFQIFLTPYQGTSITKQRFLQDEPSGVMDDPTNITIDGASATAFYSTNSAMGNSYEIWFLHGGILYEVTAPRALQQWMLNIMESWNFD